MYVRIGICISFFLSITFVCHMFAVCEIMYERLVHVVFFFFVFVFCLFVFISDSCTFRFKCMSW